jgi:hypothetical protein
VVADGGGLFPRYWNNYIDHIQWLDLLYAFEYGFTLVKHWKQVPVRATSTAVMFMLAAHEDQTVRNHEADH